MAPLDSQMKEFKKTIIGGYNTGQVDDFKGRITRDFEKMQQENKQLQLEVDSLNERLEYYKNMERALQDTMLLAEQTARNTQREAHEKAEQLLLESTLESNQMVADAKEEVYTIKKNIADLQKQYQAVKGQIKDILQNQLEVLDTLTLEPQEAAIGAEDQLNPLDQIDINPIAPTSSEDIGDDLDTSLHMDEDDRYGSNKGNSEDEEEETEDFYTKEYQIIDEEDVI